MQFIIGFGGLFIMVAILLDAFEAVLLPRRVTHGYRFIRFYYRNTWGIWRRLVQLFPSPRHRETMLSLFGPLALIVLIGLWASGLIISFGLIHWALETPITPDGTRSSLESYLYFSGTTFFTLGYGDLTPTRSLGRFLAVAESGLGFGFLAMMIGYLPVLTQSFSRREIVISLLDARGGSPPTAAQILIRNRGSQSDQSMMTNLVMWETWSAELLESSLSFPMLVYYRSQHDNQSWLAALTVILDTCALKICGTGQACPQQARLTFAIARHAAVDLTLVFKITPVGTEHDRLGTATFNKLKQLLDMASSQKWARPLTTEDKSDTKHDQEGIRPRFEAKPLNIADDSHAEGDRTELKLAELRAMYEPFVNGLAKYFLLRLPDFDIDQPAADNWQTSAWMPRTPGLLDLPNVEPGDHFE